MTTTKPVSGISYNSEGFLLGVLGDLVSSGRVSQWYLVHHDPDSDSKKAHWHLLLFPTSAVNPFALATLFDEADPANEKPLKFLPSPDTQGRCLSVPDWLLYAVHDEDYLASKGLTRNIHYDRAAVRAADTDELAERWASLPPVRLGRQALTARAVGMVAEGKGWTEILLGLGAELARDPYLVGFLREVCVSAHENGQAASALLQRLQPAQTPPKGGKGRSSRRGDPLADVPEDVLRQVGLGGRQFAGVTLPDDLDF